MNVPASDRARSMKQLLIMGLAAALLCGLLQNGARNLARVVQGRALDHGVHAWWMTPLGDALLIIPLSLILALLGTRIVTARTASVRMSVLLIPVALTGLLLVGRVHPLAQLLLAAGVSVRMGTWLAARGADRHLARFAGVLACATALLAIPFAAWPAIRERLDLGALPAARAGTPNVLVLLWDTVRASSLSLYGYERETTPHLAELARQGVVFDRAFSTASYTLPAHASLFTGRWAHELAASWRIPLESGPVTLAEVLADAGYRTGAFSANRLYVNREFGLGRGFIHFEEHRIGLQQIVRSSSLARAVATSTPVRNLLSFDDDLARVRAPDHHRKLVDWLERDGDRPWFAFVNYMEAHTPYLPREPFAHQFGWYRKGATREERRRVQVAARDEPEALPRAAALHSQRAYDASIAELDAAMADLLADLRSRGLLDNTILVITSDHGEEFGEHGIFGHGNSLYVSSTQIPLVMIYPPSIPASRRIQTTVSIRDVAPTIADLTGLDAVFPGPSLRSLWQAGMEHGPVYATIRYDPELPPTSQAAFGDVTSVADDDMQLIHRHDGHAYEMFDLTQDPSGDETADLDSATIARLRALLPSLHEASAPPRGASR
jgi:arylsulfatase A-like enzyme